VARGWDNAVGGALRLAFAEFLDTLTV
jgi:hypothetical protein